MRRIIFPHKQSGLLHKVVAWAVTITIGFTLLGVIGAAGMIGILSIGLPDVTDLENISAAQSTEIFDREGNLLYTVHGEENREYVTLDNISQYAVDATISIEDDTFYEHKGFDIFALGKAVIYEATGIGSPRGGSTITQQYIKNTFLSSARTYTRKIKELILAIRLERSYDKDEIIELYLNRIPYGNNAYGVQKAAEIYFDKDAKDLDLAESAILASLPQAPSRYNPYGNYRYSALLKEFTEEEVAYRSVEKESDLEIEEYVRGLIGQHVDMPNGEKLYIQGRSDLVLKRLFDLEKITQDERQTALNELQTIEFNDYREPIKHPHFVLQIKQILEDKYGKDIVEQGGLKVYTTIDPDIQEKAELVAEKYGESNEKNYSANNMAILTINAKTGEILAMVGSRDYFNEEIDGKVNVVYRPRQPGSSFKPLVYAQAFYEGYGPGSVIYDVPTKIGPDKPQNYDGLWQGQITLRRALAQSRNIPTIKAYFLAKEQTNIIKLAEKMGITTLNDAHSYGYPLALGAGEVPLSEMVTAYAVFANGGKKPELNGILRVENANGDILEEWKPTEFEEVIDPQIAFLINNILSDQENSVGPTLFVNGKINAAKTGTSTKENKNEAGGSSVRPSDGWTIGYTPSIVTGVWTGNTDGKGMAYSASGYSTAAPAFKDVMTEAIKNMASEPFPEPEGIQKVSVSKASGRLPGPETPAEMVIEELFPSFGIPTQVEEKTFFTVKIDKISGKLATEFTPEDSIEEVKFQYYEPIADLFNWKNEINDYFKEHGENTGEIRFGSPPTEYDDIHTAESANNAPSIQILVPSGNGKLPYGNFTVEVDIDSKNGVEKVEFYIDDQKKYFTTTPPYFGHLNISRFMDEGSLHLIVAKIIDSMGYSAQAAIEIKVDNKKDKEEEKAPEETPTVESPTTETPAE